MRSKEISKSIHLLFNEVKLGSLGVQSGRITKIPEFQDLPPDHQQVVFDAVREISGLRYFYHNLLDPALSHSAHKLGIELSKFDISQLSPVLLTCIQKLGIFHE